MEDLLSSIYENLIDRVGGPIKFRLVMKIFWNMQDKYDKAMQNER